MGINFNTNQQQRDDHQHRRRKLRKYEGMMPSTPTFEDQLLLNGLRYGPHKAPPVNEMFDDKGNYTFDPRKQFEESQNYLNSLRDLIKHKDRPTEFGPTDWRK